MKDNEKQIEEMAYVGCRLQNKPLSCSNCMWKVNCNEYDNARTHFELGYRKLPKDSVVLSREEYEKLKMFEEGHITCEDVLEFVEKARRETAEKFYDKINENICVFKLENKSKEYKDGYAKAIADICERLDQVAKQFSVEIKE